MRCHPAPEAPGNSIGLEAIIRKALMGKFDDQPEERPPSSASTTGSSGGGALPVPDGRAEDFFSQGEESSPSHTPGLLSVLTSGI